MTVVVDTTVWSIALRRKRKNLSSTQKAYQFELTRLISRGEVELLGLVRQEILSGISDRKEFERIRDYLRDFEDFEATIEDYERAATFSNLCRSRGIAYSDTDMLICSISVGADSAIFTTDSDFKRYADLLPVRIHRN